MEYTDGTGTVWVKDTGTTPTNINSAAITVTAPVSGNTPVTTAPAAGTGYTCGTVSWTPSHNPFQGSTQYTASVMLTASSGYTFPAGFTATINGYNATVSGSGNSVTVSYQFGATAAATNAPLIDGSASGTDTINLTYGYTSGNTKTYTVTGTPAPTQSATGITGATFAGGTLTIPTGLTADGSPYTVTLTAANSADTATMTVTVNVAKAAGAAVSGAPTVSGTPTQSSITVNAPTIPTNPGSQSVEYAISMTSGSTPATDWQASTTFNGLSAGTTYYVYARTASNTNYNAGAAQQSAAIQTAAAITGVCAIGGTGYPSFKDAVDSVANGGTATITMLANYTETTPIVVNNKTINLNLGVYTLNLDTSATSGSTALKVENGGKVNLTGSGTGKFNVKGSDIGLFVSGTGSEATVNDVVTTAVTSNSAVNVWDNGKATVNGNVTSAGTLFGVGVGEATVTVNGTVTSINGGGVDAGNSAVTITGSVTSKNNGVYTYGDSVVEVGGISVTANGDGLTAVAESVVTVNGDITTAMWDGVIASVEAVVTVNGNINATWNGVKVTNWAQVTVNGTIASGAGYNDILIFGIPVAPEATSSKPGYIEYTDGDRAFVWLLDANSVAFTAVQTGGSSGSADTTGIALTFSKAVTGLSPSNITITDGSGAVVKGTALSVSGNKYTIGILSVTAQGTVTVSVSNFGTYTVVNNPQTVTVYKNTSGLTTVTGVTVNPSTVTVQKGTTYQFDATVQGTNNPSQDVTWSVNSTAGSFISAGGLLSVEAGETAATLTVTATSTADGTKSGIATVTVSTTPPAPTVTSVTVNPASITLNRGDTRTFSAVVNGTYSPGQGVTWSVSGGSTGTSISATGVLTIAGNETATTLTVKAISTVDTNKSGTATVTVTQPVTGYTITFDPNGGTVSIPTMQTGADGKLPSLLPVPTRGGYSFLAWYTQRTNGTKITSDYVFTANTTVYAQWYYSGGDSSSSGGGGGSSTVAVPGSTSGTVTVNGVSVPYTYDPTFGTMTVNFTASLLDQIVAASGGSNPIVINMGGPASMKGITISFPPSWFAAHPGTSFSVQTAIGGFTLDSNVAKNFPSQTTAKVSLRKGSVILSAEQNGKAVTWNNPASPVMLYMTYTPEKDVNTNAIVLYDKATGKTVAHSFYANGRVYGAVSGPGEYDAKIVTVSAYTDTAGHWAKNDIDYVAGHGLIAGTSATAFSPNTAITRATFLTALGKLSGADVSGYKTSSFTDVKSTDAAMPYIEWAVQNKIVTGIGNNKFGPDQQITREQMALMMVNYAKVMGMTLPEVRQAVTFSDDAKISSWAKDAVKAVQRAGIITGKTNNLFDPQGSATRGEASAILHRFAENVMKGKQGWVQNDAGQWQYINAEGKAVTGWLTTTEGTKYWFDDKGIMVSGKWVQIDSKWYYFYADGKLAVNTTVDGHEVGEDGARK